MGLELGIVGLPNIGKSTLFQAITAAKAESANYPFCTIDPNIALASVPDKRLNYLCQILQPRKKIANFIKLIDIAGLVKGASSGEGLGNKFLEHIKQVDAYIHLVRCFSDADIVHISGQCSPEDDIATIKTELLLSDLERLNHRLSRLIKQTKADKQKDILIFHEKLLEHLNKGNFAKTFPIKKEEKAWLAENNLITAKPFFYVMNNTGKDTDQELQKIVQRIAKKDGVVAVEINCLFESELVKLGDQDRQSLMSELSMAESGLEKIVHTGFSLLDQISFFTAGKQEVRAWNVKNNSTVRYAAGKIHTDMYKGFIRAEVYSFEDFKKFGSETEIQNQGQLRLEGKSYLVQDGDILHIRFNV